jgi:hypothetical protein
MRHLTRILPTLLLAMACACAAPGPGDHMGATATATTATGAPGGSDGGNPGGGNPGGGNPGGGNPGGGNPGGGNPGGLLATNNDVQIGLIFAGGRPAYSFGSTAPGSTVTRNLGVGTLSYEVTVKSVTVTSQTANVFKLKATDCEGARVTAAPGYGPSCTIQIAATPDQGEHKGLVILTLASGKYEDRPLVVTGSEPGLAPDDQPESSRPGAGTNPTGTPTPTSTNPSGTPTPTR